MQNETVALYCLTHPPLTLIALLELLPGERWYGLFYTPAVCRFGALLGPEESQGAARPAWWAPLCWSQVFEARLFNERAEVRWLRLPNEAGTGQASYLSETSQPPEGNWATIESVQFPLRALTPLDRYYLLWGQQCAAEYSPANSYRDINIKAWQGHHEKEQFRMYGSLLAGLYLPPDWSCLATARIGQLPVPLRGLQQHERARLKVREYLGLAPGKAGEYGNNIVVEECLVGLEVCPPFSSKEKANV